LSSEQGPPYGLDWITRLLPHRYPMLLIDRVIELEPRRIVCLKNLTCNEAFFQGHFPGRPVMPGVYTVEALAQAAGLLLMNGRPELHGKVIFFTGIDHARFRRPVVPGDQLRLEVELLRARGHHAKLTGRALVDGQVAVEAVCSSMFAPDK
jgi:beta-hydroxyacyl-ACP dehydratase FabZ